MLNAIGRKIAATVVKIAGLIALVSVAGAIAFWRLFRTPTK
jgi:hypothetical protein